jgi:hypothetical protein
MSTGLPPALICPQCKAASLPGDAFCSNCGFASLLPVQAAPAKSAASSHSAVSIVTAASPKATRKTATAGGRAAGKPTTKALFALAGFGLLAIVLICVASLRPSSSYSESSYQTAPSTSSYYPAANTYSPAPVAAVPVQQYAAPSAMPAPVAQTPDYPASNPSLSGSPSDIMDRNIQEQTREMEAEKERNQQERDRHNQAMSDEMDAIYRKNQERALQDQRAEMEHDIAYAQEDMNQPHNTLDHIQKDQERIAYTQEKIANFDRDQARR